MYDNEQFCTNSTSGIEQIYPGKYEEKSALIKRARILQCQYKEEKELKLLKKILAPSFGIIILMMKD